MGLSPNDLLIAQYKTRVPSLMKAAKEIEEEIRAIFRGIRRVDAISARVKGIDQFIEKANRTDASGKAKYGYPLEEIQDQVGARIVVFYPSDVQPAVERLAPHFRQIENRKREDSDPSRFAYEAWHLVCFIPPDVIARHEVPINFFELQVSTLFQHAWAEASHDLAYKPNDALDYHRQRRVAWAAAQAWGADRIFDELWNEQKNDPPENGK